MVTVNAPLRACRGSIAFIALLIALMTACSASPPAPSSPLPPGHPPAARRQPEDPPGTDNLRPTPCSAAIDLTPSTPERRAFNPGARSLSGRTSLALSVRHTTGQAEWSCSRPGAVRFEGSLLESPELLAGDPGLALISVALTPSQSGAELSEAGHASTLISVPMFVLVRADAAFRQTLDTILGLADREMDVLAEARRTLDSIYDRVNLRAAWEVGFGEALPPQLTRGGFAAGRFIEATIHGGFWRCASPPSSFMSTEFGGYAEGGGTGRLTTAPVHVCPAIFSRHPDTMAWMVNSRARLFKRPEDRALYAAIVGRALGEVLAHEIGHQLLGCATTPEGRSLRCHDAVLGSLMNKAGNREFTARTGVFLKPTQYSGAGRDDFPRPGTYEDRGIAAINRLSSADQAILDRILPVPPALPAYSPCGPSPAEPE